MASIHHSLTAVPGEVEAEVEDGVAIEVEESTCLVAIVEDTEDEVPLPITQLRVVHSISTIGPRLLA